MGEQRSRILARGPGWQASHVLCTCGPEDRPFEEQHEQACVAAVLAGTFQYRSARGAATLSPGSVLLGNDGTCFECRHAHGRGDRCVAFHFSPDYIRPVLRGHRVRRRGAFVASHVPPSTELVPVLAAIEAAARHADPAALEEAGLRLLSAALAVDTGQRAQAPTLREERQVSTVIRRIEREYGEELPLSALAQGVELSPFALLRSFRRVVGMTPHQYVLRTRLQRAAVRIAETTAPVSRIAFEAGFNDLSTFNHRFRRVMGVSPRAYRTARGRR